MKAFQKLMSVFLCACLVMSLLPARAFAEENNEITVADGMIVETEGTSVKISPAPTTEKEAEPVTTPAQDPNKEAVLLSVEAVQTEPVLEPVSSQKSAPVLKPVTARSREANAAPREQSPAQPQAVGDPCTLVLYIDPDSDAGTLASTNAGTERHIGDTVTVQATANEGYEFMWWVNYITGESHTENRFTFVLTADYTEWTAVFRKYGEYFVYKNKPLDISVTPLQSAYTPGTTVTLSAPPISGHTIVYEYGLLEEGLLLSELDWQRTDSNGSFTMPACDVWVRGLYSIDLTLTYGEHGTASLSPAGPYYEGDVVTLTVAADQGYYARITGIPSTYATEGHQYTFTLDDRDPRSVTVEFLEVPVVYAHFAAYPEGTGTVEASIDQTTHIVTVTATANGNYHFAGWMNTADNHVVSHDNPYSFELTEEITLYALFTLAVVVDDTIEHGSLEIVDKKQLYAEGDTVTLLGHPDPGYVVDCYLVADYRVGTVYYRPIDGDSFVLSDCDALVSVVFAPAYTIQAEASPTGCGTVTGAGDYKEGSIVTLSAVPADGYTFMNWTENGTVVSTSANYRFTVEGNRTLTANFQSYAGMSFTIDAEAVPADGGTIQGTGTYEGGQTVTLTATAAAGYTFLNWTEDGALLSTDPTYSFIANGNRTLSAVFRNDAGVLYVDANGVSHTCEDYTVLNAGLTTLQSGWYAVAGNVTIDRRLEVSGNVNLILCDGAQLTVHPGLHLTGSHKLTIWGQAGGSGILIVDSPYENQAGIGGNEKEPGGYFTVNSGCLDVIGGMYAAGIGGGGDGNALPESFTPENCGMNTRGWAGTIVINGGTVTATGGPAGAAIGCGQRGNGGSITITGGIVNATGGGDSAAIGGAESSYAYHQSIETIHITGGTVNATGGVQGAGIGGGLWCRVGNVTIDGGTIIANGGSSSAGIGTSHFGAGGQITINAGHVTATGGEYGAGIGGGRCVYGSITITGGTVIANGGASGAGIGGGYNLGTDAYSGGNILITGGDITAIGGTSKGDSGAGIGGGAYGPGGTITISGGTVRANGGSHAIINGAGIGGGAFASAGTITITDGTVRANGGAGAPGIGSGNNNNNMQSGINSGTVIISGGDTEARGGKRAAGIGGGENIAGGTVIVSGGHTTANGGERAAGIGGGENGAGGSFRMTGGTVLAEGGNWYDFDLIAQAIGHGDKNGDAGTLSLDDPDHGKHIRVGYVTYYYGIQWANLSSREFYSHNYGYKVILEECEPHSYDRNGYCSLCGVSGGPLLEYAPYVNAEGQSQGNADCLPLTASTTLWEGGGAYHGWHTAFSDLTISDRVTVSGNVNLILCDGVTLTLPKGIEVSEGSSLTIWRQENATGVLFVGTTNGTTATADAGYAAIGGGPGQNGGAITVCGGNIYAVAGAGAQAIGHGTGAENSGALNLLCMQVFAGAQAAQPVILTERDGVCRGSVAKLAACQEHLYVNGICQYCDRHTAVNYQIPESGNFSSCTDYNLFIGQTALSEGWYIMLEDTQTDLRVSVSGNVNLILCDGAVWSANAGIGIGANSSLTLWVQSSGNERGVLIASGASGQAGIGNEGGTLTICGGIVIAQGGANGAGIGGDENGSAGSVLIRGGSVTAIGGENAAGIGGGANGNGGSVTINSSSVVTAQGGSNGAGIGGGANGNGGSLILNNGTVTTTGGTGAAGIGGGAGGAGGSLLINNGIIIAAGSPGAQAIGRGSGDADPGTMTISEYRVAYLDGFGDVQEWATFGANVDFCRNTAGTVVRLERCPAHEDTDMDGYCDYCNYVFGLYYYDPEDGTLHPCNNYTTYTGQTTLNSGWYFVETDTFVRNRIEINGDVNLVLRHGITLTARKGITVLGGQSLTIWSQGPDPLNEGKLIIPDPSYGDAGIGGADNKASGSITINGGVISITAGYRGAGIGGGGSLDDSKSGSNGGTTTIRGGTIDIIDVNDGAGIGGGAGKNGGAGGDITISGGTINIHFDSTSGGGAGIGGAEGVNGAGGASGNITISGGTITIDRSKYSTGIGGGEGSNGRGGAVNSVTITGGSVTIRGGKYGLVIGGGDGSSTDGDNGTLTLGAVRVGAEADGVISWVSSGNRDGICRSETGTIHVESCEDHKYLRGSDNGDGTHVPICWFCDFHGPSEEHHFTDNICICGTANGALPYTDPTDPDQPLKFHEAEVLTNASVNWSAGWYAVFGEINISNRITVNGEVNLILIDGGVLNSANGITVAAGNSLTIWGRSTDPSVAGQLNVANTPTGCAGIGGKSGATGTITINGGVISAVSNKTSAAIGGYSSKDGGVVVINGGTVTATAGSANSSGLGGGHGTVMITGGTVYAYGSAFGAGIGGSNASPGGTITISGGNVYATGGEHSTGIGGGGASGRDGKAGGDITISGGNITVSAGGLAPAIGGGAGGAGGKNGGDGGNITISGGTISIIGSTQSVGIGGGNASTDGDTVGTGGAGANVTITGGMVTISGTDRAFGPGSNYDSGGNYGAAGTMSIADGILVRTGENEEAANLISAAERADACQNSAWAKLEPCLHEGATYTDNGDDTHTVTCPYCTLDSWTEPHSFEDELCICGAEQQFIRILQQPEDVSVPLGEIASTSVIAEGEGLTYQWYGREANGREFTSSLKTNTYSVKLVREKVGRQVWCVITDAEGHTVTTRTATLLQEYPEGYQAPRIITQPTDVAVDSGEIASTSIVAAGEELTYQWYLRNPGTSIFSRSSLQGDTYSVTMVPSKSGREVYCVVTDKYGNTAQTNTVTLTMEIPEDYTFGITAQPESATAAPGELVSVHVEAEGAGLKYQWYFINAGSETLCTSSIKTDTYSVEMTHARNGRRLYCVVSDKYGNSATSVIVFIGYDYPDSYEPPCIVTQPENVFAGSGEMAVTSFVATGEELTYQWYLRSPGAEKWSRSSLQGDTYSVKMVAAKSGREVKCVVTDKYGATAETDVVTLTMRQPEGYELKVISQPESCTAARGEVAAATFVVEGAELQYRWYGIDPGQESVWVSGIRKNTYSITMIPTKSGRQIYCVVTDVYGNSVQSNTVTLRMG